MVSAIRSVTSSPASRRACWTARTRSRARPSSASSGVTTVSSTTNPLPASMPVAESPVSEPTTVSSTNSPSTSSSPPAVTLTPPSGLTTASQSPDFDALIAVCTSLPSRGPAARALTVSRWETPYAAASGESAASRLTCFTLTSSATIDVNGSSAAGSSTTTVSEPSGSRLRRPPALRRADVAEQISRTWSIAATNASSAGSAAASGQSARWTDRPPVRPRQTSSVVNGSSGATARHTMSSTAASVSNASGRPSQNRSRERRTYQFVSTSRKPRVVSQASAIA